MGFLSKLLSGRMRANNTVKDPIYVPFAKGLAPKSMPRIKWITSFDADWISQFGDFPLTIMGNRGIKSEVMREDLNTELLVRGSEWSFVENAVNVANEQLSTADSLADFPAFRLTVPESAVADEWNPQWGNYCLLLVKPFTQTGRKSKFPFILKINTSLSNISTSAEFSLFSNGSIGRVESTLFFNDMANGDNRRWYIVTSTIRDDRLVVSRISASLPDPKPQGSMPTLYSIGR